MKDLQVKEETSLMEGSQSDGKAGPLTLGEAWQRHISCLRCPDEMASLVEVPVGCSDRCQEAVTSSQTLTGAKFCHAGDFRLQAGDLCWASLGAHLWDLGGEVIPCAPFSPTIGGWTGEWKLRFGEAWCAKILTESHSRP